MNKPALTDFLSKGIEHTKTARELQSMIGYRSLRDVTKEINRLRNNGAVILSSNESGNEGYYLAKRKEELANFIAMMYGRIREIHKAVAPAEQAFEDWDVDGDEK